MSLPLLLAVAGLLLVACGGGATPEPASFTIEMTEYAFNPATVEVNVGQQVTLDLVNLGALEHEIMFGRDVMMMDNRPSGYQQDMFEVGGVEPQVEMVAGEMGEHYDAGMVGTFIVNP